MLQKKNIKDQNPRHKVSKDLAGKISASKGRISNWSEMSTLLDSKNDKGVPSILTFEQALELISEPTRRESLPFRKERFNCVLNTFKTFHGGVTGFPQSLEEKYGYSQFETGEILLNEIENRSSRPILEEKYRYQTIKMSDKNDPKKVIVKTIRHIVK